MLNHLRLLATVAFVCALTVALPALALSQSKNVDQRLYVGKELDKARRALTDHKFRDKEIENAFRGTDTEAVLLEMMRSGGNLQQIKVYRGTRETKGRLDPVKTLANPKDPDFSALVKNLRL
jgi:hypothetical protein